MGKLIDMTGWYMPDHGVPDSLITVIKKNKEKSAPVNGHVHVYWDCVCKCGTFFAARGTDIRAGRVLSCGCLQREIARKKMTGKPSNNKSNLVGKTYFWLTVIRDSGLRNPKTQNVLWECRCKCGNTKLATTSDLNQGHVKSCGCLISKGEAYIQQILIEGNIVFEKQKIFPDLISKNNGHLKYDFYINNSFLLEFDGIQHYEESEKCSDSLAERQERDKLKNEYAKSHNIPLKRIPYWDFDQITLENIMSDKWLI